VAFSLVDGAVPSNAAQEPESLPQIFNTDPIDAFVARLYLDVLRRGYDPEGLQFWADLLRTRTITGASAAYEFFFSQELSRIGLDNSSFIDTLYKALMNRVADPEGKAYWLDLMDAGLPREDVFAGFANSVEFENLCDASGITRGTFHPANGGYAQVFIKRLYLTTLERPADPEGIEFWLGHLGAGMTGALIAHEFIFSEEMENRELSDEGFIEILYNAMMGRPSDQAGIDFWAALMKNGATKQVVFANFVYTSEFEWICKSHGIARGTPPAPPRPAGRLAGKIIFLDPGHGTSGSPGAAGYNEAVAMLGLARRIKPLLEAHDAEVILTRDTATNYHLAARCAQINIRALEEVRNTRTDAISISEINRLIGLMQGIMRSPVSEGSRLMNTEPFRATRVIHPDLRRVFEYQNNPVIRDNFLVISLHSNATANGSTSVRGGEAYYISPGEFANTRTYYSGYSYTSQSWNFGNIILNGIDRTGIPRRSNGLRAANYMIIREINVPAVLVENGFHTNASDRALLSSPAFMDRLADAYLQAVLSYFR